MTTRLIFRFCLLAVLIWMTHSAFAQDIPPYLVHQGRLVDALNAPVEGTLPVTFNLYAEETGGTPLWTEDQTVLFSNGYYNVTLGGVQALDPDLFDGSTMYIEVVINAEALTPRLAVRSVPYAMKARSAQTAQNAVGDLTPNSVTVGGTVIDSAGVSVNGTTIIDGSGQWTGSAPAVSVGAGITGDGTAANPLMFDPSVLATVATSGNYSDLSGLPITFSDLSCGNGDVPQFSGGVWVCTPASSADTLSGLGCLDGQVPKFSGGVWSCSDDFDSDTTYSAGAGINIGAANDISVNTATVQARVSGSCLAEESIRQINADGSVVCEPDTDTNTTYSAAVGGGLSLSGTNAFGIEDGGVTSAKIADGAVGTIDLASGAVTGLKLADGAVTTSKLAADSVTSAHIIDGTIVSGDLANGAVTSLKLADGSVTNVKLGLNAVTSSNITDGAVLGVDLADGAVDGAKILDGSVNTAELANSAVTSAKIFDGSIGAIDLADGAVNSAKILDGSIVAADLSANAVATGNIVDGTIATADLAVGAVTSGTIADGTIAAADLADGSVTTAKILDGTVAAADLGADSVTSAKILDGTIVTADLAANSVATGNIIDGTVATADLGADSVTSAKIAANTIVAADVDSASVQLRVTGVCAAGSSVRSIAADGTVVCDTSSIIGTKAVPGRTCKDILTQNPRALDGIYWIDPDGAGAITPLRVVCDMRRDGGGWTMGLKMWYQAQGLFGKTGSHGAVEDALDRKGSGYKLDDAVIRAIIGSANNFDVLGDQAGHNSSYAVANNEYVILRNYTASWTYGALVAESSTTTTMQSYRAQDEALAWTGRLGCGSSGGPGTAARGINCYNVVSGSNPQGGAGCTINMGASSNAGWHHFYMSESNSDTYLYICNGAQHSSGHDMNHRFWFRER